MVGLAHPFSKWRKREKKIMMPPAGWMTICVQSDAMTSSLCSFLLRSHLWNWISLVIHLSVPLQDRAHMQNIIPAVLSLITNCIIEKDWQVSDDKKEKPWTIVGSSDVFQSSGEAHLVEPSQKMNHRLQIRLKNSIWLKQFNKQSVCHCERATNSSAMCLFKMQRSPGKSLENNSRVVPINGSSQQTTPSAWPLYITGSLHA